MGTIGLLQWLMPKENPIAVPDTAENLAEPTDVKVTDWRTLRLLDFKTGTGPEEVMSLDQKEVRIPGFMVPLEDDQNEVSEFLLVPTRQACIHVPPPPPNQMIYVKMSGGHTPYSWGPIWVQGRLSISKRESPYGQAGFDMLGRYTTKFTKENL